MKFLVSQLTEVLGERAVRQNLRGVLSYLGILALTVGVFSLGFQAIMLYEGSQHSWLTGVYWTLTVMSTLGFGDITFQSDLGRLFSIVVLLSGIVMLLIVLPFVFIRFLYAPWIEAQVRLRAPRTLAEDTEGHVIICHYDEIARGLIASLDDRDIPYVVVEPDPVEAAALHGDGISVITGPLDAAATYDALHASRARLAFTNLSDAVNTNIVLTIRELSSDLPIVALAEEMDSVDVLELAGATEVLALKHELGAQLASRITVGTPQAHRIGRYQDVVLAEFPLYHTSLAGRTIRDTRLRELTGLSVVGVWERGKLVPATPDTLLSKTSVPVVVGTEEQMLELDALFSIYMPNENPVLVIGGGTVGVAAAQELRRRDIQITILEKDPALAPLLAGVADRVVIGDAAHRETLVEAGLGKTQSVLLTTNDDAMNVFLSVYCRRLDPEVHIISRVNQDWNLEAIHRAGADFVLSYNALAAKSALSIIENRELVVVGEGADLFIEPVPSELAGKTLAESGIGATTGLNVIAIQHGQETWTNPQATVELPREGELVMLGTAAQHRAFSQLFAS